MLIKIIFPNHSHKYDFFVLTSWIIKEFEKYCISTPFCSNFRVLANIFMTAFFSLLRLEFLCGLKFSNILQSFAN